MCGSSNDDDSWGTFLLIVGGVGLIFLGVVCVVGVLVFLPRG